MSFDYRGRIAVVTGASSGIGRAISLDLAARGTTVVAAARRRELLDEVVDRCRKTAPASEAIVTDVSDRSAAEDLIQRVLERHGHVDVLVNNAGITLRLIASKVTVEDVERLMHVNFFGAVYTTMAVLPSMLSRGDGRIVNISSVAGRMGSPHESAYTASKFALTGFSEVLAADLDGTGVRVHVVYPGPIRTDMWQNRPEPPIYRGKLFPPAVIASAVRSCLEHNHFERWAPRRVGFPLFARAFAPSQFIKGLARYARRSQRSSDT